MSRKILFICNTLNRASTRYRVVHYLGRLQEAGWEARHVDAPRTPLQWWRLAPLIRQSEVVVVSRRLFSPAGSWLLRKLCRRLVFDFDDAVHHGNSEKGSARRKRRFRFFLERCDEVWAGNEYLAKEAAAFNDTVVVLPTSIEPARYLVQGDKPADQIDLVWIGSSSTGKYLKEILPVLAGAFRRIPGLRLKVIADFDLPSPPLPVVCVPWNEQVEAVELSRSHVGIAPLPDDAWTRGKCGCKVLQYMAAGLPVIASAVPVHEKLIADGKTGMIVRDHASWVEAIRRLAEDPDLRRRMGEAGRVRASESYSLDVTWQKMRTRLEALAGKERE